MVYSTVDFKLTISFFYWLYDVYGSLHERQKSISQNLIFNFLFGKNTRNVLKDYYEFICLIIIIIFNAIFLFHYLKFILNFFFKYCRYVQCTFDIEFMRCRIVIYYVTLNYLHKEKCLKCC